jgi:hypothetical protein
VLQFVGLNQLAAGHLYYAIIKLFVVYVSLLPAIGFATARVILDAC